LSRRSALRDQMKQRFQDRMKSWGQKGDAAKGADEEE